MKNLSCGTVFLLFKKTFVVTTVTLIAHTLVYGQMPSIASQDIIAKELVQEVSLVGGWAHINGGHDMETGIGDRVPVRCSTNLYIEDDKVMVKVFYHIEEYGGDHTIFSGSRKYILYQNTNPAYALRTVEISGPRLNSFQTFTEGENHQFVDFSITNSYWERLQFCVDGPGPHDDEVVGVRGTLKLKVILERLPDAVKASKRL